MNTADRWGDSAGPTSEMIRKICIAMLFVSALGLTALGVAGLGRNIEHAGLLAARHWGRVRLGGGNLQVVHARAAVGATPRWDVIILRGPLGALSVHAGGNARWHWWAASVPVWILVSTLFTGPAVAYARGPIRRRRRLRQNQCLDCGYSLIGNTSGRCPECGNLIPNRDPVGHAQIP